MTSPPIKLAVLDDYAGIAESKFQHLSSRVEVSFFPETLNGRTLSGRAGLVRRLQHYTIISTMRERTAFPAEVLCQLPNLQLLLTTGMKNASIDMKACRELGITVAGTQARHDPTNEHTWALILGLAKNIASGDSMVKNVPGGWQPGLSLALAQKTLGLLGLGRLGTQCAVTGMLGFGMKVICWSSNLTQEKADDVATARGLAKGSFRVVASKAALFEQADILSIHYVLSERSKGIVGEQELRVMKKNAMLVNTSRGPLIDEKALLKVLEEGKIRGAALDVFDTEPLEDSSPWRSPKWGQDGRSQVLLSPHMGYVAEEVMHAWYDQTAENVERWLDGSEILRKIG